MTLPYRKAVVLGAAGFIGVNLAHTLLTRGFQVVCFDRTHSTAWPETVIKIVGEFSESPQALLNELDHAIIFHLISSSKPSLDTSLALAEIKDLTATIWYLEFTRARNVRWVFLSSGGTVYGHTTKAALAETDPTRPICSYGVLKLTIERYLALYHVLYQLDHVTIRLANPYGPGQHPLTGQGIIARMLYLLSNGGVLEIWGDGENVRDYIYITDATAGIVDAAVFGASGEIYNVGTGIGTSINQLLAAVEFSAQIQLRTKYTDARAVDVRRNVLSCTKLAEICEWKAVTDLGTGVDLSRQWIIDNFMKR